MKQEQNQAQSNTEIFIRQLKEKGYSKATLTGYRTVLKFFKGNAITAENIRAYQNQIQDKSVISRLHYLSLLRNFLRTVEPKLIKELIIPKKERRIPKEIPGKNEMRQILQKPDLSSFNGIRDRAILELLYSTGIRKQELINLKLEDIQNQIIRIEQGKMGKDRIIPISAVALKWLKKYIEECRGYFKPKCRYVFVGDSGQKLSNSKPYKIVKQYSRYSPHKYRHSFATHLLQNGMKEPCLQRLLGHALISTTEIYTQVSIAELKQSYLKFHDRDHFDRLSDRGRRSQELGEEKNISILSPDFCLLSPKKTNENS